VDVLVLGAGVIGLTTAVTLAEAGHRVLVRTAEPPLNTTSAAAGALWGPWLVEPRDRVLRWAQRTLHALSELSTQPGTGVRLVSGKDVSRVQHQPPAWLSLVSDARPCRPDELPSGYFHGTRYTAPLVDMPVHLAYLTERLRLAGAAIEISAVHKLDEAMTLAPVVVNCTGLGARSLVGDQDLYPVRGQHVVVTNPGVCEFLEVDTGDSADLIAIYPHADHLILGGTAELGSSNREPDLAIADAILQRCAAIEPLLQHAELLGHRAGLRPTRPEVRLAEQPGYAGARVIHNYGHGGAGVTLAFGCAEAVQALILHGDRRS
jgi:D-amino-acid oxidase